MGTRVTSSGRTYRTSSGSGSRGSKGNKGSSSNYTQKAMELEEIKEEIKNLTRNALRLIPRNTTAYSRAQSYWYAHILGALDKDNEFMGGSMFNMQDTIDELKEM